MLNSLSVENDVLNLKSIRRRLRKPLILDRLRSIYLDSLFVKRICEVYFPEYPSFANLRSGAWYLNMNNVLDRQKDNLSNGKERFFRRTCHFKSTDGHESR